MTVPPEIWLTIGYLVGGLVIALTACIFCAYIGTYMVGWIQEAFETMKL
jgi:hypothetical protein